MATHNFYLNPKSKDGLSVIMLVFQHKGRKFKFSTKIKTRQEQWDGRRIKSKTIEAYEANEQLSMLESYLNELIKELLAKKQELNLEAIEAKFKLKLNVATDKSEFFTYWNQFVTDANATKTAGTIKHYGSTKTRLLEFEKWRRKQITFTEINNYFYESFLKYCMLELKLLNNSTGQHVKNLKVFLNYLMNNELINVKFNLKGFKAFKEDIDIVHLTYEELIRVYELEGLPAHLDQVKDFFCFECFTGLRFSDVCRLKQENIKDHHIEIRTLKTRDLLYIPLNDFAKAIIDKYKPHSTERPLPPVISNQKTNVYLKEIAEIAQLDDVLIIEKFCGAKRIEIVKPKYNLIATHTGRRTFITLSYEKGMKPEIIMKITGIKKWDTLKKYLRISDNTKLLEMNNYWNRPNKVVV